MKSKSQPRSAPVTVSRKRRRQPRSDPGLDEDVRCAARELAHRYGCSTSEAIRRAVLRHRDSVIGIPPSRRAERVRILERLFVLFQDHDPADEVRRLKEQDEGF